MKKLFSALLFIIPSVLFSQTITVTGSLNTARWIHETQLLNNGKVLTFGGNLGDDQDYPTVLSSSELYNPTTHTWTFTGSMNVARHYFSSVLLNDGNVLAIGGIDQGGNALTSCEIYNVATGTWQLVSSLNFARGVSCSVKLMDGRVLVAAGLAYASNNAEIYDPVLNTWTLTANLVEYHGMGMAMALLDDGKVLATGGDQAFQVAELFDPATSKWTKLTSTTVAQREYHSIIRLNTGKFLLVGSTLISPFAQITTELYDPVTKTFTTTGNLLTGSGSSPMCTLDDGRILLYTTGDPFTPLDTKLLQFYDPATGTWSTTTTSFIGRQAATVTRLNNSEVLLTGGALPFGPAYDDCFLVYQNQYSSCTPPILGLAATGGIACNGSNASVTLPTSESGVTYEAWLGDRYLNVSQMGGSALTLTIPANVLAPGTNVITIKANKPGCTRFALTDTAVVTMKLPAIARPVITPLGNTVVCTGGNVVLSAPASMTAYQWSNGATTQNITVTTSGYYKVRVQDASGCYTQYSDFVQVVVGPTSVNAGADQLFCGSVAPYTLTGFSPQGGTWSGTGVTPAGLYTPNPGTITLTYSMCGLTDTKTVSSYQIPDAPDFNYTLNNDSICYGSYTTVSIQNPIAGATYQLCKGNTILNSVYSTSTSVISFTTEMGMIANTVYTLRSIKTNTCGSDTLTKSFTLSLRIDRNLTVGTKKPFVCQGDSSSVYIVNSQRKVKYQLRINARDIGPAVYGNGDTLFLKTGPLRYTAVYTVNGTAANVTGGSCYSDMYQQVQINVSSNAAYFTVSHYNPEINQSISIINNSVNTGGTYSWTFDAGASMATSTAQAPPNISYSTLGSKNIKLIINAQDGCKDTIVRKINVIAPVVKSSFEYSVASRALLTSFVYDKFGNSYLLTPTSAGDQYNYSQHGDSLSAINTESAGFQYRQVLVKYDAKGIIQWSTYLCSKVSYINGYLKADSLGNIYVFSSYGRNYSDSIRFYSTDGEFVSIKKPYFSNQEAYLVKYDANGLYQWNVLTDYSGSILFDKQLNIYSCSNNLITKYTSTGQVQWTKSSPGYVGYSSIKFDSKENICALRAAELTIDKYDSNGNLILTTTPVVTGVLNNGPPMPTYVYPQYLNVDRNDNFYVAGNYRGSFVVNKDTLFNLTDYGGNDLFICKINKYGNPEWVKQINGDDVIAFSGMDLKADTIIFQGASNTSIRYNKVAKNTFRDLLPYAATGVFVGITDTTSNLNVRLTKLTDNSNAGVYNNYVTSSSIVYSPLNNSFVTCLSIATETVLGHTMSLIPTPSSLSPRHVILLHSWASDLFPNIPPRSFFTTTAATKCVNTPITFKDFSSENPTSWSWTFAGGIPATSTAKNPIVTFATPGAHVVTLTATNATGTGNTYTTTITISNGTSVIQVTPNSVCEGGNVTLTATGASNFTWNNGLSGSVITLNHILHDTTVVAYGVSSNGCSTAYTHTVTIVDAPVVTAGAVTDPVCEGYAGLISLPAGTPTGGVYSGTGVIGDGFVAYLLSPGHNTVFYSYTDGTSGCTGTADIDIVVSPLPTVTIDSFDPICDVFVPIDLSMHVQPAGGVYGGFAEPTGIFDATAFSDGVYGVSYTYTDALGCENTAYTDISLGHTPYVSFTGVAPVCENGPPLDIRINSGTYPWDGVYSGVGVQNGYFDPANLSPGTYTITYTVTDYSGCSASMDADVIINPTPQVYFDPQGPLCDTDVPLDLTTIGHPQGGWNFVINGVMDSYLDPSVYGIGTYAITYYYTDQQGCTDSAKTSIDILNCTGANQQQSVNAVTVYPNPCSNSFTIDMNASTESYDLVIYNSAGVSVFGEKMKFSGTTEVNVSTLSKGLYHIVMTDGKGGVVERNVVIE